MEKHKSAPKARTHKNKNNLNAAAQWLTHLQEGQGQELGGRRRAWSRPLGQQRRMLTANCTHIVRAEAIIINFPAKLNFNAFAAAEMKMKIASIGKIAKKSSGCCALGCVYTMCVCVCAWQFY